MADCVYNDLGLKLENEELLEYNPMTIDVLDFNFHISGGMEKGTNSEMTSRYHVYFSEDFEIGSEITIDLEVLVRYITNFKLNAYLNQEPDVCLIPKNEVRFKEVHFLRFETNLTKIKTTFWNILMIHRYMNLDNMENACWRITDIDGRFGRARC